MLSAETIRRSPGRFWAQPLPCPCPKAGSSDKHPPCRGRVRRRWREHTRTAGSAQGGFEGVWGPCSGLKRPGPDKSTDPQPAAPSFEAVKTPDSSEVTLNAVDLSVHGEASGPVCPAGPLDLRCQGQKAYLGPRGSFRPALRLQTSPSPGAPPAPAVSGSRELGLCLGRRAPLCPCASASVVVSPVPWTQIALSPSISRSTFPPNPVFCYSPSLASPSSPIPPPTTSKKCWNWVSQ